jgi:hypothetical protein
MMKRVRMSELMRMKKRKQEKGRRLEGLYTRLNSPPSTSLAPRAVKSPSVIP